jgi:acetate kinase
MAAAMGGLDALAFTAGAGERSPPPRALAAQRLSFLGVELEQAANDSATSDTAISPPGAEVAVVVVTAREDLEIVRQVRSVLAIRGAADDRTPVIGPGSAAGSFPSRFLGGIRA